MMNETTAKCHICGDPYKVYPFCAGDQSACPDCVSKANRKMVGVLPPKSDGTLYEEHELPASLDLAPGQVVCITYKKVIGTYQDKGKIHKSWGGAVRIYRKRDPT